MKYFLLTLLFLYIFYKLSGFFLRTFLRVQINKFERDFGQARSYTTQQRQEGDIFIQTKKSNSSSSKNKNDDGDYVDYEVVK